MPAAIFFVFVNIKVVMCLHYPFPFVSATPQRTGVKEEKQMSFVAAPAHTPVLCHTFCFNTFYR